MSIAESVLPPTLQPLESPPRTVQWLDPLTDERWPKLLSEHPRASVFHSREWLRSLQRTYSYQPVVYTTCGSDTPLTNAVVFCKVNSWLTGHRLVSVPFSDHCDPLLDEDEKCFESVMTAVQEEADSKKLRYVEVRSTLPCEIESPKARKKISFFFHTLDLSPSLGELFAGCHHSSTRRKIRRAEREQLTCREGRTEDLLSLFYELFTATRQRHHIPPPPRKWFSNLLHEFGNSIKISVAFNKRRHVAAIITLRYKDTFIYKYGACDPAFTNQGSMQFLLWRAIEEAKVSGFRHFDFGRTDVWQQGLVTFKDRWGTARTQIEYRRYSRSERKTLHVFELNSRPAWKRASQAIVSHLPARLLVTIGSSLYGHAG